MCEMCIQIAPTEGCSCSHKSRTMIQRLYASLLRLSPWLYPIQTSTAAQVPKLHPLLSFCSSGTEVTNSSSSSNSSRRIGSGVALQNPVGLALFNRSIIKFIPYFLKRALPIANNLDCTDPYLGKVALIGCACVSFDVVTGFNFIAGTGKNSKC